MPANGRHLSIILATIAVGCAALAWFQQQRAKAANAERAALRAQISALEGRLREAEQAKAELRRSRDEAARTALEKAPMRIVQTTTTVLNPSLKLDGKSRAGIAAGSFSMASELAPISTTPLERYAYLRRKFVFSKPQWNTFLALTRYGAVSEPAGPDAGRTEAIERIREAFGEPVAAAFRHLEDTAPWQPLVNELALRLLRTPTPLLAAHADALLDACHTAASTPVPTRWSAADRETLVARAAGFLSPPQTEVLAILLDQQAGRN